jgi:hypothetical protein
MPKTNIKINAVEIGPVNRNTEGKKTLDMQITLRMVKTNQSQSTYL